MAFLSTPELLVSLNSLKINLMWGGSIPLLNELKASPELIPSLALEFVS